MAFTLEHTATHRTTTYRLTVTADAGQLTLDLHGSSETEGVVADGTIRLPVSGTAETARLLTRALTAAGAFDSTRKRGTAPNSHAPWTQDQDTALRADWQTYKETTPATTAIRELATARQRSPGSIRARLSRIGCDPDVPGRLLTPETAELIGRTTPAR
ncbi:hypothetical protein [Actinokineospora fastidiosa]|uniref:Uncharacterized protein n=1 Tax=Actinokineospora fastidiosa TaxID=1816 RepID=A0A918G564_9PSEU|nr:hypothetical protein [Actinokineospora fastidiosa]GGS17627.1 hypothetical protein GCM10010171_07630 [Actinokineospora fastidiosa]